MNKGNISGLSIDLYELFMAQVYFHHKPGARATFDLFIRSRGRPFYLACGIDEAADFLESFRFSPCDIQYLKDIGLFDEEFLDYLAGFRFKGDVWAVEEPEIVFSNQPVLRVTGGLIETQLVESGLLNRINLGCTLATKAARVALAARGRPVYDFSLRRTQGPEAGLACAKYSYIAGIEGTSNVSAGKKYNIPVVGTMAHSYVMSFDREVMSFLCFAKEFPARTVLLVDTYDVERGMASAIRIARFLRSRGISFFGVRLDSGDLLEGARYARRILDKEGFIDAAVYVSGNLDENKIEELLKAKAPVDAFGVGTSLGCSSDLPYTDVVYKLVEIKDKGRGVIPTMKLSGGKTTYPGRKQIYRCFDGRGKMSHDVIRMEGEKGEGKKLLKPLMRKGQKARPEKSIVIKRKTAKEKILSLPGVFRNHPGGESYPVKISRGLDSLTRSLTSQIKQRNKEKTVFMDIDTQYDFISRKGALSIPGAEDIVKNLKGLTRYAKKNNILIISTQDSHRKDDPEFREFPPHCVKGTAGWKKIKETSLDICKKVSPKKVYTDEEIFSVIETYPQIIIEKDRINIFSNFNLERLLRNVFPDRIVIYGLATDYCVREAVEGCLRNNFKVTVVEDAIKPIINKEGERLILYWKNKGVELINTAMVYTKLGND